MGMQHGWTENGAGLQSSKCCTEDRRRTSHATWHACSGWDLSVLAARAAIQATSTPTPSHALPLGELKLCGPEHLPF